MRFASVLQATGKNDEKEVSARLGFSSTTKEAAIINDALFEYCEKNKGRKLAKNLQVEFEFHIPCG